MPGIVGIINIIHRDKGIEGINLMLNSMMQEPFYNSGTYTDDSLGVSVGWICHKGSFSDCMPIWNEKKTLLLVFFGENFTDLDLFDKLKARHHKFDNTNASYLIHLYEEKGIDFLQDLNGWFSGLLIDIPKRIFLLFNDRYGMQRIYFHETQDAFYFSSEAKALLRVHPELREVDPRGLGEYLCCGCVLEYRTLFNKVFRLPGGSAWQFHSGGRIEKQHYFKARDWEDQPWLEKQFFFEKLKTTITSILPRYFRGEQKIGISLTGGLDTRIILALMEIPAGKYPCYTFGGTYRDCYDVKIARKIADLCGQNHQVLPLDGKFLTRFPEYAEKTVYISDGCLDVSASPEVYLNGLAREMAPIRMTGNFGGEVLRGIGGLLKANPPYQDLFSADLQDQFRMAAETLGDLIRGVENPVSFNLFTEISLLRNNYFLAEQSQLIPRSPYLDNDLVALMYRAPTRIRGNRDLSLRLVAEGNPLLYSVVTDRGYAGNKKVPLALLNRKYLEFLVKAEYAYDYGMPQWLAKTDHSLSRFHLEKLFLGHHKFTHFRIWYRDALAGYIRTILLDEKALNRSYLNRKKVEAMIDGHLRGVGNYTTEITKILTLELVHRLFIENQ